MNITDKIALDALKTNQDAHLNASVNTLLKDKISAFNKYGIEGLLSGPDSIFNTIKRYIGKFQPDFTNSTNIVDENKKQFLSNIEGFDELPEDLK